MNTENKQANTSVESAKPTSSRSKKILIILTVIILILVATLIFFAVKDKLFAGSNYIEHIDTTSPEIAIIDALCDNGYAELYRYSVSDECKTIIIKGSIYTKNKKQVVSQSINEIETESMLWKDGKDGIIAICSDLKAGTITIITSDKSGSSSSIHDISKYTKRVDRSSSTSVTIGRNDIQYSKNMRLLKSTFKLKKSDTSKADRMQIVFTVKFK